MFITAPMRKVPRPSGGSVLRISSDDLVISTLSSLSPPASPGLPRWGEWRSLGVEDPPRMVGKGGGLSRMHNSDEDEDEDEV